jgi:hypothetical protein
VADGKIAGGTHLPNKMTVCVRGNLCSIQKKNEYQHGESGRFKFLNYRDNNESVKHIYELICAFAAVLMG